MFARLLVAAPYSSQLEGRIVGGADAQEGQFLIKFRCGNWARTSAAPQRGAHLWLGSSVNQRLAPCTRTAASAPPPCSPIVLSAWPTRRATVPATETLVARPSSTASSWALPDASLAAVAAPIPTAMPRSSTTVTGSLRTPICNRVKAFLANIKWQHLNIIVLMALQIIS